MDFRIESKQVPEASASPRESLWTREQCHFCLIGSESLFLFSYFRALSSFFVQSLIVLFPHTQATA